MCAVGDSLSDRSASGLMLYLINTDWIRTVRDGSATAHGLLPTHYGLFSESSETAYNCEPLSPIITCYMAVLRMTAFIQDISCFGFAFRYGCSVKRMPYCFLACIMLARDDVGGDTGCDYGFKDCSSLEHIDDET